MDKLLKEYRELTEGELGKTKQHSAQNELLKFDSDSDTALYYQIIRL